MDKQTNRLTNSPSALPTHSSLGARVTTKLVIDHFCCNNLIACLPVTNSKTAPEIYKPLTYHVVDLICVVILQIETAALRELKEETGLDITVDNCVDNAIPVIALWEVGVCYFL